MASWALRMGRAPRGKVRKHSSAMARELLGYEPVYKPEAAAKEAVAWLIDRGQLSVENPMTG